MLSKLEEYNLKKIVSVALMCLILTSVVCVAVYADNSPGPAPNSGDGESDGSGFDQRDNPGRGPAPGSGDGISDGPEW